LATVGNGSNLFSLIRARYNTLSASQKAVAEYVLDNAEDVMTKSLSDLAEALFRQRAHGHAFSPQTGLRILPGFPR
jgi:hypothetical protein